MEKSIKITLIIVCVIILIAIITSVYLFSQSKSKTERSTISAEGEAKIKIKPDLVTIYFYVETNGTTAQEAKDKNAEIINKTVEALKNIGISQEKIQTEDFVIYPEYNWINGEQKLKGYKTVHSFKLILDSAQIEKVSSVVDAGIDAGAMINNINFELSTEKQNYYKIESLKLASQDAKLKAEAIAFGLGKKLGKLISVSDVSFDYYPWPIYRRSGLTAKEEIQEAKRAVTNIMPSEQEVIARVSVVYEIID